MPPDIARKSNTYYNAYRFARRNARRNVICLASIVVSPRSTYVKSPRINRARICKATEVKHTWKKSKYSRKSKAFFFHFCKISLLQRAVASVDFKKFVQFIEKKRKSINMKFHVLLSLVINFYFTRLCLSVNTKILSLCTSQNTCENCLEANLSCAWCSDWVRFGFFHIFRKE